MVSISARILVGRKAVVGLVLRIAARLRWRGVDGRARLARLSRLASLARGIAALIVRRMALIGLGAVATSIFMPR